MQIATRHLCLAVLLALLVGHASFAVHATSHGILDVADCNLCISHSDASDALPSEPSQRLRSGRDAYSTVDATKVFEARNRVPFLQRGPPASA